MNITLLFLGAYLTYFLATFLFHLTFSSIPNKLQFNLFSPSYSFAKFFKGNLKKKPRARLIKRWNKNNLLVSFALIFSSFILSFNNFFIPLTDINLIKDLKLLIFLILLIFIRCFSRSYEIIRAFYKDVTNNKNLSKLNKYRRIRLASISYLEVIFNFSTLYFLIFLFVENTTPLPEISFFNMHSDLKIFVNDIPNLILKNEELKIIGSKIITTSTYYPTNILYFILASFFISTGTRIIGINPFFLLQLATSLSLLIFAIAGYISDIKNHSDKNNKSN